jgi:hypothetical protein
VLDWKSKSAYVGSPMTTSAKVRTSFLVSTMSIHQQEKLNVVEGSTCNYFRPTWKLAFHAMVAKVLQITSWFPMHSLPGAQCKRWIPIGSMGCVQTHRRCLQLKDGVVQIRYNVVEKNWGR